jgi:hypothetical protein
MSPLFGLVYVTIQNLSDSFNEDYTIHYEGYNRYIRSGTVKKGEHVEFTINISEEMGAFGVQSITIDSE